MGTYRLINFHSRRPRCVRPRVASDWTYIVWRISIWGALDGWGPWITATEAHDLLRQCPTETWVSRLNKIETELGIASIYSTGEQLGITHRHVDYRGTEQESPPCTAQRNRVMDRRHVQYRGTEPAIARPPCTVQGNTARDRRHVQYRGTQPSNAHHKALPSQVYRASNISENIPYKNTGGGVILATLSIDCR